MMYSEPWQHLVADDFLPAEVLDQSVKEVAAESYEFGIEYRGAGRIEFSLLRSETLWRAVYSKRTVALLKQAFGVQAALNKQNMLQLRRMNDDTPDFPTHHDHVEGGHTIVSFLYLSPGWSGKCGGRFNLFEANDQETPSSSIEPIQNRFLAFRASPSHWHSVDGVRGWERLSVLALWDIEPS
jgi:hypothetical protein